MIIIPALALRKFPKILQFQFRAIGKFAVRGSGGERVSDK
jgi:hypothetical protein